MNNGRFPAHKYDQHGIEKTTNATSIEETIKEIGWRNIGHILRRERNDNRRIALQWTPGGMREKR